MITVDFARNYLNEFITQGLIKSGGIGDGQVMGNKIYFKSLDKRYQSIWVSIESEFSNFPGMVKISFYKYSDTFTEYLNPVILNNRQVDQLSLF